MNGKISNYNELRVFQNAVNAAVKIFHATGTFPDEEKNNLTDHIRRSSRAVCVNIAKAWRKRRFKTPFVAKLGDSEAEACETQLLVEFARRFKYLEDGLCAELDAAYDQIIGQLAKMMNQPEKWLIKKSAGPESGPVYRPAVDE